MQYTTTAGINYGFAERFSSRLKFTTVGVAVVAAGILGVNQQTLIGPTDKATPQTKIIGNVGKNNSSGAGSGSPNSNSTSSPQNAPGPAIASSSPAAAPPLSPQAAAAPMTLTLQQPTGTPLLGGMGGGETTAPAPPPPASTVPGSPLEPIVQAIDPIIQPVAP